MIKVTSNADQVSRQVKTISKSVELWVRFALGQEADKFRDYIRRVWLHGRALNYRTGRTHDHVDVWIRGNGVYVRPGVGILGWQNYLARWVGTELEFMKPGFREFSASGRIEKAVKENVDKMMEKVCEK